uniref:Uncharacterized LOC111216479 n=1 Tax=Seriola dumerili TaxID=41447 RepID=A0A3B4U953_SERDU
MLNVCDVSHPLSNLLCFSSVSSSPPSPINVNFSSVNLMNLVQWSPGNGTPVDTHFTVQYAIKGKRVHWRAVHQCTDIVRRWCDLSSETSDQEQGYYARVRAVGRKGSSKWTLTERRFDPKTDTSFGPPLVTVEVENCNAIITLKGPVRYQPNNHTPVIPMAALYPQMTYSLFIHNSRRDQTHHFPVVSSPYKYQRMEHETEYCFRAEASLVSMPILCQSSAWHCITTPKDPVTEQLQWTVWGIVVPSLCICVLVVVGYFLRNYLMGKGQESPHTLLNLILISVIENKSPSGIGTAISDPASPKKHITCPPPRYSPQRPETPTEPDDLSLDYGLVGIAECPGLFLTKKPQTDICVPLTNLQTNEKVGMGERDGKVRVRRDGKIDGTVEEGSESEKVALMSAYASQNINNIPNSHKDQSVLLPNDYSVVLSLATANGIEDDEDEDDGSICINWDPETKKLLLPEMAMKFNKEGALGGLKQGQEGSKDKMGGEEEKVNALKSELKLENVFVRQGCEEEAEALREMETGGETGSETDDTLTKWDLVISLDQ